MGISGNLILVGFGRILRLIELSGFLRYKVDISGNFRLVGPSGFSRFRFKVETVNCKTLLLAMGGSK